MRRTCLTILRAIGAVAMTTAPAIATRGPASAGNACPKVTPARKSSVEPARRKASSRGW
jgi:hypothetical protein